MAPALAIAGVGAPAGLASLRPRAFRIGQAPAASRFAVRPVTSTCGPASFGKGAVRRVAPSAKAKAENAKRWEAMVPRAELSSGGGGGGKGSSGGGGGGGDGDGEGSKGGLWGIWFAYLALLDKHPLPTKMVTSGILNALGDVIAQFYIEKAKSLDVKRCGIFFTLGAFLVGPMLHFWYGILGKIVTVGGTKGALMSLALDQLCYAPVFVSTFFVGLFTLMGTPELIVPKLKQDLWPSMLMNWRIWPLGQYLNFRYVPPHLNVAVSNLIALVWNTYISWAGSKQVEA